MSQTENKILISLSIGCLIGAVYLLKPVKHNKTIIITTHQSHLTTKILKQLPNGIDTKNPNQANEQSFAEETNMVSSTNKEFPQKNLAIETESQNSENESIQVDSVRDAEIFVSATINTSISNYISSYKAEDLHKYRNQVLSAIELGVVREADLENVFETHILEWIKAEDFDPDKEPMKKQLAIRDLLFLQNELFGSEAAVFLADLINKKFAETGHTRNIFNQLHEDLTK